MAATTDALPAAVGWIESLLTGAVATSIAVIAIAGLGFSMLAGDTPVRRGARAVLGCFVLFGASLIARGLMDLAHGASGGSTAIAQPPPVSTPAPIAPPHFDPYAGASVPLR